MDKEKLLRLYEKHKGDSMKWKKIAAGAKEPSVERVRGIIRRMLVQEEVGNKGKSGMADSREKLLNLSNLILDGLKKQIPLFKIPYKKPFRGKLKESAVLMLSDIHAAKVNKFMNSETGENEITYNSRIMVEEAKRLVESVHDVVRILSPTYDLEKLYIFMLGDLIENDVIFKGQRFSIESGAGKQMLLVVKLVVDLLNSFLGIFKEIEVISVPGNHGRFSAAREDVPASNSFDYLASKMLEMTFSNEKRIKFTIPESWFYVQKIYNWKYFLHHGETSRSWMGLPYYGIVRQSKARRIEVPHNIECLAHWHVRMEIPTSAGCYSMVNGSWVPKDSFAWKWCQGAMSRPEQTFFGVSPKRPRTWSYSLELQKD